MTRVLCGSTILEDGTKKPEADDELIRAVQEEMAYQIEEKLRKI